MVKFLSYDKENPIKPICLTFNRRRFTMAKKQSKYRRYVCTHNDCSYEFEIDMREFPSFFEPKKGEIKILVSEQPCPVCGKLIEIRPDNLNIIGPA